MEAKKKSEFRLLVDKMNFIPQDIRTEIKKSFMKSYTEFTNKNKEPDLNLTKKISTSEIYSTEGSSENYIQTDKNKNSKSLEKFQYSKTFQEIMEYNFDNKIIKKNLYEKEVNSNIFFNDFKKKNSLVCNIINNRSINFKNEIFNIKSKFSELTINSEENFSNTLINIDKSRLFRIDFNPIISKKSEEISNEENSDKENSNNKNSDDENFNNEKSDINIENINHEENKSFIDDLQPLKESEEKEIIKKLFLIVENNQKDFSKFKLETEKKLTVTEKKLTVTEKKLTVTEKKLTVTEKKLTETEKKLTESETFKVEITNKINNIKDVTDKKFDVLVKYFEDLTEIVSELEENNLELKNYARDFSEIARPLQLRKNLEFFILKYYEISMHELEIILGKNYIINMIFLLMREYVILTEYKQNYCRKFPIKSFESFQVYINCDNNDLKKK